MRPVRIIAALLSAATIGTLTLFAAPASAASTTPPVVVQVSPTPVLVGTSVTLSGSVGPDAAGADCSNLILYSTGFAPTNHLSELTAVYATAKPSGAFSATTPISHFMLAGSYTIHLRCGGATVGGGTLVVRAVTPTPPAALRVSPSSVTAGDRVTLSGSVGPHQPDSDCTDRVTLYSNAFAHTEGFDELPAVLAAATPNGTFTVTTTIPRSKPAGTYPISGHCRFAKFAGATLEVRTAPTTPTTIRERMPPTPPEPPADPPVTQPQPPAPMVAGSATPPTSQLTSDWVIPGLAALGSGTLAALGVWLLYRRRHPAYPSR